VTTRLPHDEVVALLEQVEAAAHIGSWVAELDGSDRLRWSAETYRIFGLSDRDFGGTFEAFYALVHPDDLANVQAARAAAVLGHAPYEIEHRVLRADGSVRWVHAKAEIVRDTAGLAQRMIGTAHDITDRRQLEDDFRQSQKTQAIGRLAGGIAHDLNNALTAISGYAELALNAVPAPHVARADIEEIRKAAERAAAVMRQLLAFSRRELLEPRVFDLNAAVTGVGRMLSHLIGSDVQLQSRLESDLPPIYGDPGQVEQAIVNLALNARDAMPDGGTLTCETLVRQVDDEFARKHRAPMAAGEYVVLLVSDTGHGMTQSTQSRIFEPFFTTKASGKGTGLGLSMVFGTVKQSGGFIFVESEVGLGTTFSLYFPPAPKSKELPRLAPVAGARPERLERSPVELPKTPTGVAGATAPAASDAVAPGSPGNAETLLIVEDEPAVRNLVSSSLRGEGYRLLVASSGPEAVKLAAAHDAPIDLLLTDAMMPGQTGPELARELSTKRPEMAVIIMSGYTGDMLGINAMGEAVGMLQKPFTPRELRARIREVLTARTPSSTSI